MSTIQRIERFSSPHPEIINLPPLGGSAKDIIDIENVLGAKKRIRRLQKNGWSSVNAAFDIGAQICHVQDGKTYKQHQTDVETYLTEMYAKGRIRNYRREIRFLPDPSNPSGPPQPQLGWLNGGEWVSEAQSWKVPTLLEDKPQWAVERAKKDEEETAVTEELLKGASLGQTFYNLSPAPFDVMSEEKKKLGFGTQSFLRLYTYTNGPDGNPYLDSYSIRLEMEEAGIKELYRKLSGEAVETKELLGRVGILSPHFDFSRVQKIFTETEAKYWNGVSIEDSSLKNKPEDISKFMSYLANWNKGLYQLMRNPLALSQRDKIVQLFNGMEMAFLNLVLGKESEIDVEALKGTDPYREFEFVGNMTEAQKVSFAQEMFNNETITDIELRRRAVMFMFSNGTVYRTGFACDGTGASIGKALNSFTMMGFASGSSVLINGQAGFRYGGMGSYTFEKSEEVIYAMRPEHGYKCVDCHGEKETGQCGLCRECAAKYPV